MKKTEWNEAMNQIDNDLVESYVKQQKSYVNRKLWVRVGAIAACLAVIIGSVVFVLTGEKNNSPRYLDHTPIIFNALENPQKLSGSKAEYNFNGGGGTSGVHSAPPRFEFDIGNLVVIARVCYNYPDVYYKLDVNSEYAPGAYRLIEMELIEVLHGENLPSRFLYLIPESLYVDMSIYDCLIISMSQLGVSNYLLQNGSKNQIDFFELPVFCDDTNSPELGNIIAFSDNVFDETLWQNESWIYGYQFARNMLDHAEEYADYYEVDYYPYVLKRGYSIDMVVANIEAFLEEYKEFNKRWYYVPSVCSAEFTTQEAREAIEYVKPFANGVFSQTYESSRENSKLIFKRFINGCQTEETIKIDIATQEVTYSMVRYTREDLSRLDNIAVHLSALAAEYQKQLPIPPHIDPSDKMLSQLSLYAWYAKVDGKVYGVVKTTWRYLRRDSEDERIWYSSYDEAYILYDMSEMRARSIEQNELIALLGHRNVHRGELGKEKERPL